MDAATLHTEIAKVCPVISTRVGVENNRDTWSFTPGDAATDSEKAAGQNVINTIPVDFTPPPEAQPEGTVLYDHENRLRTLEGQPPLTLDDFAKTLQTKAK